MLPEQMRGHRLNRANGRFARPDLQTRGSFYTGGGVKRPMSLSYPSRAPYWPSISNAKAKQKEESGSNEIKATVEKPKLNKPDY
jgi:hypothetical protein